MPALNTISEQHGVIFRAASTADLDSLATLGFPPVVIDFYARHEPEKPVEGAVILWPLNRVIAENTNLNPGAITAPLGYYVFATTYCGDAYCFDANTTDAAGHPRIVLISHEVLSEEASKEEVSMMAKRVADNLEDFLNQFVHDDIDHDCIY